MRSRTCVHWRECDEVFWGETKEKRSFEDRHESTKAYIDYMRRRCLELHRVLKRTGSFYYYHCDWHASHYVTVMRKARAAERQSPTAPVSHSGLLRQVKLERQLRSGFPVAPKLSEGGFVHYDNGRTAEVSWSFIRELPPTPGSKC